MSSGQLNILAGEYGLNDVTPKLLSLVNREANPHTLSVQVSDSLLGDTLPERSKTLTIVYRYDDGLSRFATASVGDTLSITGEDFRDSLAEIRIDGRNVVISEPAVLCLDNAGQVWVNSLQTWAQVPALKGIQSMSSAEGTMLWYTQGTPGEDNPILFSHDNGTNATKTNGAAAQISAGRDGEAWALTTTSTLLRWNRESSTWEPQPGRLSQIAVASAEWQWGLDGNNNIARRLPADKTWRIMAAGPAASPIKFLTVSEDGVPFIVTADGLAYMHVSEEISWVPIGSSEVKVRSLTIPSFKEAWCVTQEGAPMFIGTTEPSIVAEVPFPDEVVAEWDTESVFDEKKSSHLYIVNRAAQLASTDSTLGAFIKQTLQPMAGQPPSSNPFRAGMCQGLYDADFKGAYNNPLPIFGPTYKSHFYDANTGRNWLHDKEPTALTNGVQFFNASVAAMTSPDPKPYQAGYYLGLALHYFTDLTQPMHAGNYTYLSSLPFGYHTDFETYMLNIQAKLNPQPKVTGFLRGGPTDPAGLYKLIANRSKAAFYLAVIQAIRYGEFGKWRRSPQRWQSTVLKFLPDIMEFAVASTAQLLYIWADLAKAIKISNGMRVRVASTGATFVVIDNILRGISNVGTYDNLFTDWVNVINIPSAQPYPAGSNLSDDASIIGAVDNAPPADKKTYLLTNGNKRWITSGPVFERYGFNWQKLNKLTVEKLNAIPNGPPIN
jgi:phospholipase C